MATAVADQGTVWWPPGLSGQEKVRVVFNLALTERPERITCEDFETREPIDVAVDAIEQSGTREWGRYTAATLHFHKAEQRGRSFRWRAHAGK